MTEISSVAETKPLSVGAANFRTHKLVQLSPQLCAVVPGFGAQIFGGLFLTVGAFLLGMGVSQHEWGAGFGGIVFSLIGFGLIVWMKRVEFDRGRSCVRLRGIRTKTEWSLSAVRGLQLIDGGWHGDETEYFTYQLNLLLHDRNRPRINLSNNTDVSWALKTGLEIARFIGVPFEDRRAATSHRRS